jgi:hypothetical protein
MTAVLKLNPESSEPPAGNYSHRSRALISASG